MEFGRVTDVESLELVLPPDAERNAEFLARAAATPARRRVLLGNPSWSNRGLIGRLYPRGTRSADFLRHYSRAFTANELNSTYYGFDRERIERWAASVPEGFLFCPKLPATISHERGLVDAEREMERFIEALQGFGSRLGRVWAVLPPGFGPERQAVLAAFVERFAARVPLAIEFRHAGWFTAPRALDAAFDLFEEQRVTAVITDVAGRRDVLHMTHSTTDAFVRFVGNGLHPSDFMRLDDWVERITRWVATGIDTVYFFLHEPDDAQTVDLARYLIPRLEERVGTPVATMPAEERQLDLF